MKNTYMHGPADICIGVVSPGSVTTDYGEKLEEYEAGGVGEYWIIDPQRQNCHFYRSTDKRGFVNRAIDAQGGYQTPALPRFRLHIPTVWQEPLPDILAVVGQVQSWFDESPEE